MKELYEHVDVSHIYIKEISSSVTNKRKSQTNLTGPSSLLKKLTLSLKIEKTNNQCTLQSNVKANQKSISIQQRIMDDYNKNVNLVRDYKNKTEDFARSNCLSVVHTGVNKMLSNAEIIGNYKCNLKT